MDADRLAAIALSVGLVRAPEESEEHFQDRVVTTLQLMSPRPVTLRDYCDLATAYAGWGAHVVGREPGERHVALTVTLPWYRRYFRWERRRVRNRVWQKVNEEREVNFIVSVRVE